MPRATAPAKKSSEKEARGNFTPEDSGPSFKEWARMAELQPVPLILADGDGQILLANSAAQTLLGYARHELEGRTLGETVAALDELRDCEAVAVSTSTPCELEVVRADGETRMVVGRLIEFPWFDSPSESTLGCALWLQDVTAWTAPVDEAGEDIGSEFAAEPEEFGDVEAVHSLDEFERLNECLPAALGDLKHPLGASLVLAELLLEETAENGPREDLRALLNELQSMKLALEALVCGSRELRSTRQHAIDEALRETLDLLSPRFDSAALRTIDEVGDLPTLPFDPAGVRAIAFQLLTNALEACPPGAELRLFAQLDSEHEMLELGVSDTGPGMSAEVKTQCADPFFSTREGHGGLGLALVQQAIEQADGELWVDSEEGRGCTLLVRLPIARPTPAPATQV